MSDRRNERPSQQEYFKKLHSLRKAKQFAHINSKLNEGREEEPVEIQSTRNIVNHIEITVSDNCLNSK